jgi:hypothetical protein
MFDTIVSNVLVPAAIVALLVVSLRRLPRAGTRRHERPSDPQMDWIRTAAILSGFGPFWYSADLARRLDASAGGPSTKEGDAR